MKPARRLLQKVNQPLEFRARDVAERALEGGSDRVLIVYETAAKACVYSTGPTGTPKKREVQR